MLLSVCLISEWVKTNKLLLLASRSKKNINCSIDESLKRFDDVVKTAKQEGIAIRGYVSCVVDCPYSGKVRWLGHSP